MQSDLDKAVEEITPEVNQAADVRTTLKQCLLSWFCGMEPGGEGGESEAAARREALLSTVETKWGRLTVEINLVLLLTCGVFVWGFFA